MAKPMPHGGKAKAAASKRTRAAPLRAVAFKPKEEIHDWRVKEMVVKVGLYFNDFWSAGKVELADELLADDCVHKNMVWGERLAVGPRALQGLVTATKRAYPDLYVEVEQVAVCDTTSVFVQWGGKATNLGEFHEHRPSYHQSSISGVSLIRFNHDRSRISEIVVYRQALYDEEQELKASADESDLHTLHIARLHFDEKASH